MRLWIVSVLALAFVAMVNSCQKKDGVSPVIEIITPAENSIYNVFDTVWVQYNVADETDLVQVVAQLVNADFVPVGESQIASVSSSTFSGVAGLIIDNKLLPTGDYYIMVMANDGTNEKRAYRKIKVVALPKLRRAIYCASYSGQIWQVDSQLQSATPWAQHIGDVGEMVVNSENDRLTVVSKFDTRITNFSLATKALQWSDDVFAAAQAIRFNDLKGYSNQVYVALYDRELRRYNLSGALTLNIPTPDHRPELIHVDANYLVVEMELTGANDHFIFVYQASTDALLRQFDVPMDVVSMCAFDEDEIMLFGNENGNAKVILYNMTNNAWWEPRQLPNGLVIAAAKLDGRTYAIAHSNGIYTYTYSPNYLNLIRPGGGFQQVTFDEGNGTILATNGQNLEEMTTGGQLLNSLTLPESIASFDIHYTR